MKLHTLFCIMPLVVGSAASVLASISPANAVVFNFNVGGTDYSVTTVYGTYSNVSAQLESTAWWGNQPLASTLAQGVVNDTISYSNNILSYLTPAFVTGFVPSTGQSQFTWTAAISPSGNTAQGIDSTTSNTNYLFAVQTNATPVPFNTSNGATVFSISSLFTLFAIRKTRQHMASKTV